MARLRPVRANRSSALPRPSFLRFWVSAAVALAFADASIAVLGLPQIIDRLHTSISHVVWVIAAYNAALIAGSLAVIFLPSHRLRSQPTLIVGLVIFGAASVGSGAAGSLTVLVAFRVLQGLGGALLLCGSLPSLAAATRAGQSPLAGWAAAAAIGAALGPAAGGLLTQVFDWRAIFLSQAPVAALTAAVIWFSPVPVQPAASDDAPPASDPAVTGGDRLTGLQPAMANVALVFLSSALIGALFLSTVLLINVWGLTPLAAAVVLTVIPLTTAVSGRLGRGRSAARLGAIGAATLAVGLIVLALVSHRQLVLAILALVLSGTGLGLSFPPLTDTALRGVAHPLAAAARTIAARDSGLVVGLLILTPILVDQLAAAPSKAIPPITRAVFSAPISNSMKVQLGTGLLYAGAHSSQSQLPNISPAFARVAARASPATKLELDRLKLKVHSLIEVAATGSFRLPLFYCALFAVLVLPLLAVRPRQRLRRAIAE